MLSVRLTQPELISLIIPAFNSEKFLDDCLCSVLKQKLSQIEILVINDGSNDKTADICANYLGKIRYFYQNRKGASSARNLGLKNAKGEFIAFLDADDMLMSNALEILKEPLTKHKEKIVSIGLHQEIRQINGQWENLKSPYRGAYLSGIMFKKEVLNAIGTLDEHITIGEDIDWFFRLRESKIPIAYLNQVVLLYRRHNRNSSNNYLEVQQGILKACRNSLNRRQLNEPQHRLETFGESLNYEK